MDAPEGGRGGPDASCDVIRAASDRDAAAVIGIFNQHVAAGFAAYTEFPAPPSFYAALRGGTFAFYVLEVAGIVVGFGSSRPLYPFPAFRGAALLSYFIAPEQTGRGLGTRLLERLATDARARGCTTLVANVSSRNEQSLRFHAARGFGEVGRLRNVGVKFGQPFDLVWLQRDIEHSV